MNLSNPERAAIGALATSVARHTGCRYTDLLQGTRGTKSIASKRTVLYLATRLLYPYASWSALGRALGRDRKTVRIGVAQAQEDHGRLAVAESVVIWYRTFHAAG